MKQVYRRSNFGLMNTLTTKIAIFGVVYDFLISNWKKKKSRNHIVIIFFCNFERFFFTFALKNLLKICCNLIVIQTESKFNCKRLSLLQLRKIFADFSTYLPLMWEWYRKCAIAIGNSHLFILRRISAALNNEVFH